MATDEERLVVAIEARIRDFERNMAKAAGTAGNQFGAIERRAKQAADRMERSLRTSTANINGLLRTLGVGIGLNELRQLAERWSDITSRVNIAAGSQERGAAVMDRVSQIARRTYSDLGQTAEAYIANSTAMKELGYSSQTQLDYTEALNNALVVSGAKGQRAESVMNALSKAMALGELRGENLNTVISTGGRVAEALAAGLGVTTNELRALGQQGQLTGDKVVKALTGQLETLRTEAESMPATISDAMVLLKNSMTEYVGKIDEARGVTSILSDAIIIAADNVESIGSAAAAAGLVIMGKYVPGLIRATAAQAAMLATNPFLMLATAIGAATFALTAFGDDLKPIEGDLATLGDYAGVTWTAIKEGVLEAGQIVRDVFVSAVNLISKALGGAEISMADLADFVKRSANLMIGSFTLLYERIKITFGQLPAAIAEAVIGAMNSMIAGVESGLNTVIGTVNSTIESLNSVGEAVGISLGTIGDVTLGRIENAYAGAGEAAGAAYSEAFRRATTTDFVGDGFEQLRRLANERARLRAEGGTDDGNEIDTVDRPTPPRPVPGGGGRGGRAGGDRGNAFDLQVQQIEHRIAAMRAETDARRQATGTIEEQERAVEEARMRHELLTAAQRAGIAITPELQERIDALASAYSAASHEAQDLARSTEEAAQRAEEWRNMSVDLVKGFIADLRAGEDPLDAILAGLNRIADKLLDMAINKLFENAFSGGGGGGGFFGWLFKLFGFKDGGEIDAGKHAPRVLKLAGGGPVSGPGGPKDDRVPALLSDGEFVVNAASTAKHRKLLEAINAGTIPAFAAGGIIGDEGAARMARIIRPGGQAVAGDVVAPTFTVNAPITVNGSAGTPEQNADLAAQMARELEQTMRGVVNEEIMRATRPGNLLNRRG